MSVKVQSVNGETLEWSYQHGLIMLHGNFLSCQWHPDHIGVNLYQQMDGSIYLGISAIIPRHLSLSYYTQAHQTFILNRVCFEEIKVFFNSLGFPCHKAQAINGVTTNGNVETLLS